MIKKKYQWSSEEDGAQDAEAQAAGDAQDDGEAQEVGAAQEEADGEPEIVFVP